MARRQITIEAMAQELTREAALAWRRGWEVANERALQELRDTPLARKLRRIAVMLASGRDPAFTKGRTEDTEAARAIWLRLKAR